MEPIIQLIRPNLLTGDPEEFITELVRLLQGIGNERGLDQQNEPQRLFALREYRAAVISAMTLFESKLRRTIATLGKTKGHVKDIQGMMRHSKASTTDVYMQSLEPEVRSAINSIYDELMGNGTTGQAPQGPSGATAVSPSERNWTAQQRTERLRDAVSGQEKAAEAKPVRGVILEFATKMRQSRGREVLLNDWWT